MTQVRVLRSTPGSCLPGTPRIRFLRARAVVKFSSAPAPGRVKFCRKEQNSSTATVRPARPRITICRQETDHLPEFCYQLDSGSRVTLAISAGSRRELVEFCQATNAHGREVGGILAGHFRQTWQEGCCHYQVCVTDVIPIEALDSSSDHISFGELAWGRAEWEVASRHAAQGKRKLGWYHTHPTQGIFFSIQDREAHATFNAPYHIALVVDPRSMEAGLFYWRDRLSRIMAGPIRFLLTGKRS